MSSIIVLDSSDEETDSANKKPRLGPAAVRTTGKDLAQIPQSMARVNPVKVPNSVTKKSVTLPNDNFKIHLPSKRPTQNEPSTDQVPEKRIRRVKPTTVVRSNDEEWINRQAGCVISRNGEQPRVNPPTSLLSKNLVNSVKGPIRVVKSPITVGSPIRSVQGQGPARVIVSSAAGSNAKANASNYVRVAWNGKDPKPTSPPVINKNITACVKEPPKASISPPVINKNITASIKEQTKVVSLSPPIFNKNSVTIRRVVVNEERPKVTPSTTRIPSNAATKTDQAKPSVTTMNATSIRRVPITTDPLKITLPPSVPNKIINNSTLRITQVNATSPMLNTSATSIRRITGNPDPGKVSQSLPPLKRIPNTARANQNNDPIAVATSTPSVLYTNPATIKRIVTVDLPKTPASPPVITKSYNTGPKRVNNDQPKSSMSMSVITKNHTSAIRTSDKKMSPPVLPKPLPPIMAQQPSGLIVTPITCTASTMPTSAAPPPPPPNKPSRLTLSSARPTSKQSKTTPSRAKSGLSAVDQSMASLSQSMFNMFPPVGSFMGGPPMIYDMDLSGGAFINPAYIPNRPMRSLESSSYPTMTPPTFNMNYPSFSGGSITPILSPGTAPSPTNNTGRSSKSPVTSTVTRSSSTTRSPAGFMGMPIDVDQPIPPMSPPVFNMNHPAFNGDPFNFMRSSHNIPSPAYSPVRSTRSPNTSKSSFINPTTESGGQPVTTPSSPVFHKDLDNFVKNPFSYPRAPCNTSTSSAIIGNGPIFSVDSPVRNHHPGSGNSPTGFFKSPTSTSPAQSTISEGSSMSEFFNQLPPNGEGKPHKSIDEKTKESGKNEKQEDGKKVQELDEEDDEELNEEEKEPLNTEYETLLKACREADSSEDMNRLIESKLIRYYYSVHPDFVKSRGFRKAVVAATESIKKNPDLVYYHLRPVVEEMKARKKSKAIVMTNDETSAAAAAAAAADEGIEDKVRNRQIRRLNKALYILTRKIHKLENEEVDLDDENSSYLIVERYKKRACEIYDKICDLTGESKHALRQVKKPITFKETDYPKFNKVVETFVNRTKEFPDFFDVLRMLEFCNERYTFGLLKEEMTMIAQDAFIKIGKLLQSRRKADLYETVSHFTSDYEDPAANDPALFAKLSENEKNQTSIGSIIDKYAREQVRRKAESAAESINASADELNNTSESCDTDEQSHDDEEQSNNNNNNNNNNNDSDKKPGKENKEPIKATTNGTHTPSSPHIISSASPSPSASTSAAFRTSPPHAFASPEASPRPRSPSLPPLSLPQIQQQPWTTNSLKILSVTSLNDSASGKETVLNPIIKPSVASIDEIIISDEDL